ncbi:hypothetical protein B0G57_12746 [Trinickia symbiotica]|nr:hypothetical protein B0G57_12746 [Trinickia symbiotica]
MTSGFSADHSDLKETDWRGRSLRLSHVVAHRFLSSCQMPSRTHSLTMRKGKVNGTHLSVTSLSTPVTLLV